MRGNMLLLLVIVGAIPLTVAAEGDPVSGRQKVTLCSQCHGIDGNSVDASIPKLAGQLENYIIQATLEFQRNIRRDPVMSKMANLIVKLQDLEDIAAYYSAQEAMQGEPKENDSVRRGKSLFTSERCNYCHGEGGRRFAPFKMHSAPVIGGQHQPYLVKALKDIRDGKRPGDIYDLMVQTLGALSKADIEAIAEYLSSL